MKVLFTGMSSSHCKPTKNVSFFQTVAKAYEEFADVTWSEPKLSWKRSDLEHFDEIIFGFSPPTSMGANHLYAAIQVLNKLYESPKLKLVVDSPQMWQYKNSIKAFKRDPDQIFGSFYSNRKNYSEAKSGQTRDHADGLSEKLSTVEWPTTLVPALPWADADSIKAKVDFISSDSVKPLNLDSLLLTRETPNIGRREQWAADNVNSSWTKTIEGTTRFPIISVKNSNKPKDAEVEERIKSSIGLLVAPQDRKIGTWWSYRYVQGLNTITPIATHWGDALSLGEEWAYLPYHIEDMQPYERQHVAFTQLRSYEAAIPDKDSAIKNLQNLVIDFQTRGR